MAYAVVIEQAPNNYAAYVPDLPGCIATAKTREETFRLICEGIEIYIDELQRMGQTVPEPQHVELIMSVPSASLPKPARRGKGVAAVASP